MATFDPYADLKQRLGEVCALAQELRDCLWPPPLAAGVPPPFPLGGGRAGDEGESLDLRVVLSLRDDYLGHLDELSGVLPHDVFAHRCRIQNQDAEKATLAIIKPAERFGLPVEEALCQRLVADLDDRGVEPANLQIVLDELYQDAGPFLACLLSRLMQATTSLGSTCKVALPCSVNAQTPRWTSSASPNFFR